MPRFDGRFFPSSTVTKWNGGKFGTPGWVPNEPTGVTATPGDQQITLEWSPGRSNGLAITGYKIEKNSGSWSTTHSNTASAAGSKVITGLTNGTAYTFRVKAINKLGESEVTSATSVSAIPRGVPFAPGTLSLAAGSPPTTVIGLSWSAPSNNNGNAVSGYSIQKSTDGSSWSSVTADTGNTNTTYTVTGLSDDTQYYFKVAAVNVAGIGVYGNEPTLTTSAAISATGGTITTDGSYKVHTFTSSGTFAVTAGGEGVEMLMVSGGGSGGGYKHPWSPQTVGGGGGGGGCVNEYTLTGTDESLTVANSTNYAVTVGAGYTSSGGGGYGGNPAKLIGGSIDYRTGECGGGRGDGGNPDTTAAGGGSAPHEDTGGGGGNGCYVFGTPYGTIFSYPAGTSPSSANNSGNVGGVAGDDGGGTGGKWYRQGDGQYANTMAGGGGGGGGPSGTNGSNGYSPNTSNTSASNYGGAGGNGTASSFSGSSVTYSGGGGGNAGTANNNNAAGGTGGGGQGGTGLAGAGGGAAATAGTANLGGGGGGGGGGSTKTAQNGGSGIVIIRYLA